MTDHVGLRSSYEKMQLLTQCQGPTATNLMSRQNPVTTFTLLYMTPQPGRVRNFGH